MTNITETEGYSKFKEKGEKLKEEVSNEKRELTKERMSSLAQLQENSTLAQMYQDNASVGAENLAGELPLLKIHTVGKSTKNLLADGNKPNDGWFFYKPTQEQFQTIDCHILTISRGFRADGLNNNKDVFHQIVAGVITNDNALKPFIFYFTGKKLSKLWEFGKQAAMYTRLKPMPIPMFALKVRLSTFSETNSYGESWLVNFEIVKDETGFPLVVSDPGEFQYLRDHVDTIKDTIESLVATKSTETTNDDAIAVAEQILSPKT